MKFALCSEVFKTPIEETIRHIAEVGFDGIEIAPFNVAPSVDDVSPERRRELARLAGQSGLEIIGLHWLLVSPEGLHLTSPEATVRRRTIDYLKSLVHFCADLGGKVLVLGSPRQRSIPPGRDPGEARREAVKGLRKVAAEAGERGVRLLLEPLTPRETNFLNTVEEALDLAREIDHPQVGYILDTKAMSAMPEGIEGTLRRHGGGAAHFHANEPGGLGPGMGSVDFRPIFRALVESGYRGWASAEPFDYGPDSLTVARAALKTMRAAAAAAGARNMTEDTSGIVDFVGSYRKPLPLSSPEVEKITPKGKEGAPEVKIDLNSGEHVKIKEGPFENFDGVVDEIFPAKGMVKIIVTVNGRATPIELEYWQVEKI